MGCTSHTLVLTKSYRLTTASALQVSFVLLGILWLLASTSSQSCPTTQESQFLYEEKETNHVFRLLVAQRKRCRYYFKITEAEAKIRRPDQPAPSTAAHLLGNSCCCTACSHIPQAANGTGGNPSMQGSSPWHPVLGGGGAGQGNKKEEWGKK